MQRPRQLLRALASDTRGLTTVEYAIVLCLIAVVGVGVWSTFGQTVKANLEAADSQIGGALGDATGANSD